MVSEFELFCTFLSRFMKKVISLWRVFLHCLLSVNADGQLCSVKVWLVFIGRRHAKQGFQNCAGLVSFPSCRLRFFKLPFHEDEGEVNCRKRRKTRKEVF